MNNHYSRLLAELKSQREAGDIDDAAFKRGAKELERQMNEELAAAKAKAEGTSKHQQHSMSGQQVAALVHRCNGANEMDAISARAHADRLGIDWKGA